MLNSNVVELAYALAWKVGFRFNAPKAAQRAIFTRIWLTNRWGNDESRSGPGSTEHRGAEIRPALLQLFAQYQVSTLLDAPCGDFNWMRDVTPGVISQYIGADVVEELIDRNRILYEAEARRFLCCDVIRDPLPNVDLVLCRDAFIHWSFSDIAAALANFKRSGSRYLLTTTFIDVPRNADTRTGGWRRLNLQAEPFCFPVPLALIDDIPHGGVGAGKRLALWKLESIGGP